mgnify:CR=1 FL=1
MWGSDDPDERKPLWWKELTFNQETRTNIKPGTKLYDQVQFNQQLLDYYKQIIKIRKTNPVLSSGKIEFLKAEGTTLVYKRFDNKNLIYVLFNLSNEPADSGLTLDGNFEDLLKKDSFYDKKVKIPPMSALILKRKS